MTKRTDDDYTADVMKNFVKLHADNQERLKAEVKEYYAKMIDDTLWMTPEQRQEYLWGCYNSFVELNVHQHEEKKKRRRASTKNRSITRRLRDQGKSK